MLLVAVSISSRSRAQRGELVQPTVAGGQAGGALVLEVGQRRRAAAHLAQACAQRGRGRRGGHGPLAGVLGLGLQVLQAGVIEGLGRGNVGGVPAPGGEPGLEVRGKAAQRDDVGSQ